MRTRSAIYRGEFQGGVAQRRQAPLVATTAPNPGISQCWPVLLSKKAPEHDVGSLVVVWLPADPEVDHYLSNVGVLFRFHTHAIALSVG